ncbi:MAG: hypothetical protein CSA23_02395 [Deltaproteobacteria bacterium]|nr:MAG: hypothetical protein CSA23_02395 [Deltaproteobacteria bacterium]
MNKIKSSLLVLIGCLIVSIAKPILADDDGWTKVAGNVLYNGTPVSAMVLANGQHVFSSWGDGSFDFTCPPGSEQEITVLVFCNGLAPYSQTVSPAEAAALTVVMERSDSDPALTIDATVEAKNNSRGVIEGTVSRNGQPVCAMVLANGQHAFTCSDKSKPKGSFSLDVPLETDGSVTFYGFCRGLPPYKYVYTAEEIGTYEPDQDGRESFSPTTYKDAAGTPMILYWDYHIANDGIQIAVEGTTMNFNFNDIHLSIDPHSLVRRGSFSGSVSGAASGSCTADFAENLVTAEGKTLIDSQEMDIGMNLSFLGQSAVVSIDAATQWNSPVEWFLDRTDLDQLPDGYTYSEAGTVSGTADIDATITGSGMDKTTRNSVPITSVETWKIVGHQASMTVNQTTYTNIVEVVRTTTIPQYTNGTIGQEDVEVHYWVARGIGMIKSIGHFSFMGEPLTLELTGTNLTQ